MPVQEGQTKKHFTPEERKDVFDQICVMYQSQGATLKSICEAHGISERTFRLWTSENAEYAAIYKKARQIGRVEHWESVIKPLADTAIVRLLKGETKTETTIKRAVTEMGDLDIVERIEKTSDILPHATVAMFAAKALDPDMFIQKNETAVTVNNDEWFLKLPLEKRIAILEIAQQDEVKPGSEDTD